MHKSPISRAKTPPLMLKLKSALENLTHKIHTSRLKGSILSNKVPHLRLNCISQFDSLFLVHKDQYYNK